MKKDIKTIKKVYLASPFFNEKEIERMENVRDILREKELDVFVPFENQHEELQFGSDEWRVTTFNGDINGIDEADVVVAIISNGNYDDSGSCFEVGYSYAKGIPVIVVNLSDNTLNLMISDSLHAYISNLDELKEYDFDKMNKIPYKGEVL